MARKLPWSGNAEPPKKRQRTIETSIKSSSSPKSPKRNGGPPEPGRETPHIAAPSRRRAASRSPSTSPPPAPPDVEPMIAGYEADDVYMMVEDEFQTLAQSFTRHLHHAEYKRLERKAKEAPRKPLPEPVSPMSKKTKHILRRELLADKQQETLDRIISGKSTAPKDDAAEEKVDDPWRGTHLAGLMAAGSQERRSLKGLDRLPSSTRAAKGFSRTESDEEDAENARTVSATTKILGGSMLRRKQYVAADETSDALRDKPNTGHPSTWTSSKRPELPRRREPSPVREVDANGPSVNRTDRTPFNQSPPTSARSMKPSLPFKKKQVKPESKEDRLAEIPMFLF